MAWVTDRRPDWSRGALLPVVVTDAEDGALLMLAWADAEAVAATEASGQAHFHSRSRDALWRKGASSGNVLDVVELAVDCDADAIVYRVRPRGPVCHTGARSCFEGEDRFDLRALAGIIAERGAAADPDVSYTARLLAAGPRKPAEKVTEEAGELSAAALAGSDAEVAAEAADLVYHLLVLLASRGIGLETVEAELARRHGASG